MAIDLTRLTPPQVIENTDFETILATIKLNLISIFPEITEKLSLESEPITKLLEVFVYREMLLRARINDAAKSVMLAYAQNSDLDHLAALLGVERLPDENDERLRMRAQLSLEGKTVAGSRASYIFHAFSVSNQIADVSVENSEPGTVLVTILGAGDQFIASQSLLDQVYQYLSTDERRPLTDTVRVQAAEVLAYEILATLYFDVGPSSHLILDIAKKSVQKYAEEQFKLGANITLSGVYSALHQPGVKRVVLQNPQGDLILNSQQAARCTSIQLLIGENSV